MAILSGKSFFGSVLYLLIISQLGCKAKLPPV